MKALRIVGFIVGVTVYAASWAGGVPPVGRGIVLHRTDAGAMRTEPIGEIPSPAVYSSVAPRGPQVVWEYVNDDVTPLCVAIDSMPTGVTAALGLPASQVLQFDTWGQGAPLWSYDLGQCLFVQTSVSGDGSVVLASWANLNSGTGGIVRWAPDSSAPVWQYDFPRSSICMALAEVSRDGSTVYGAASTETGWLIMVQLDPQTGEVVWEREEYLVVSDLQVLDLSRTGEYALVVDLGAAYVIDVWDMSVRWQGSSTIAFGYSISGDGRLIALAQGFINFYLELREWNGTTYQERWRYQPSGSWLFDVAKLSDDGSTLVVGCLDWDDYGHNKVMVFDTGSNVPLWTEETKSSDELQDNVAHGAVSDDGSRFVIGYWGNQGQTHAELIVWDRESPDPLYAYDTPGSVYGVDITPDGSHVAACCKRIHANQPGYGGRIYSIDVYNGLSVSVSNYPTEPVSPGESFSYDLTVENSGPDPEMLDQVVVEAHGNVEKSLVLWEGEKIIPSGRSITRQVTLKVPGNTPTGDYVVDTVIKNDGFRIDGDAFVTVVE